MRSRAGLAAFCAAVVCFGCSSSNGGAPGGEAGAGGRGSSDKDGGGAAGRGGSAAAGGGHAGSAGRAGAGGNPVSAGGMTTVLDASPDAPAVTPPSGGGDAGPPDAGEGGVAEWPLVLPEKGVCTVEGFCWDAPTPLGNSLQSVWGSGPNDVWFAGYAGSGTLAHWDGAKVRGLAGLEKDWGTTLTGTAANDVWLLGGPHALHYDGAAWSRFSTGTDQVLAAAHAVTSTLVYAVGAGGTVVKWDGTAWTAVVSGTTEDLTAVWAFDENDVWIAGTTAYHFTGSGWSSAPACSAFWGDAPNDLYCVRAGLVLARWDGAKWTDIAQIPETPVRGLWGTGAKDVVVLARGATYRYDGTAFAIAPGAGGIGYDDSAPHGLGMWAAAADDYWAAGPRSGAAPGSLFRLNGTSPEADAGKAGDSGAATGWAPLGSNLALGGVACTNQATAFVGTGIAWTAYSDPSVGNKLERWNGTTYTDYPPGTDQPLLAIDALSAADIWVTAEGGDVTHFDGSHWTAGNVGAKVSLSALYAAAPTSVWAGGEAGTIYEYDGADWVDRSVKMNELVQLAGTGPNDVWAVGDKTFHYTKKWAEVALPKEWPRLVAVWGSDPNDLRGVALSAASPDTCSTACSSACTGAVLKWDGAAWTFFSSGAPACGATPRPVFKSFYSSGASAWATDGQYAYHWNDVTWTHDALPSDPTDLACGVSGDGQQILVAGPYPILRGKSLL